jgi:hypothetical protein
MSAAFVLTPELQDAILRLAAQPDIRSISCPFDEFDLWRGLLNEQMRRATRLGLPAQEALCLMGPQSGIPGITPIPLIYEDESYPPEPDPRTGGFAPHRWGGEIHIPYEGACGGDLFILPKWHNVFLERLAGPSAKFSYLLSGKRCNYLLTNRDLGELPCATRADCAGSFLYKNMQPYPDCNPFHESRYF